jgi:hypothetical protein
MSSESKRDPERSAFSWESVVRARSSPNDPASAEFVAAVEPPSGLASEAVVDPEPELFTLPPLDLGFAPLTLDPLPSTPASTVPATAPESPAAVLGEFHVDLKIAPLDMPDLTPSGSTPKLDPRPAVEPVDAPSPPPPAPAAPSNRAFEPSGAAPALAPESVLEPMIAPAPAIPGLPASPVSSDPNPTTVLPAALEQQVAAPALPPHQPSQVRTAYVGAVSLRATHVPAPAESRQKRQKSNGGGGIALFFTLFVLVGVIVGAVVFGRPYLFPDDWDPDAKPYGEAVESVRGVDIAEPLLIDRQASATYNVLMADHLLGEWEADLPMWRSLALANGPIDATGLRSLVTDWTPAYYSPETSQVIANSDLLPGAVDGAVTEAMALAAIDQETGWTAQVDTASLETRALIEAVALAESQNVSRSTSFGAAIHPERRIDVAAFLPPMLEYRINAPQTFVEFAESGVSNSAGTSLLALSREPELAATDTVTTSQQQMDRAFWYMVFAAYNPPADAYAATNALVQSSLATADRSGVQCTYATFSGTDVAGTEQLANVLQAWVLTAPVELAATSSVLADGSQQLSSCDPGAGFASGARFGVGREIARWRTVEFAAIENVDRRAGTAADRGLAVEQVRATQAALPIVALPFDTPYVEFARLARALVLTDDGSLGTPATQPAVGTLGE